MVIRTMRQTVMQKSAQVVYGTFGKTLPVRIHPSDIRRNSVPTLPRQTGNLQQLQLWMKRSFLISQTFANVTLAPEML